MADYLKVVYDLDSHPETEYPDQLARHLFYRFSMQPGQKLLEPGCGRGEFLNGFQKLGMDCYGVDLSPQSGSMLKGVEVQVADLEQDRLPYEDGSFDFIYHKSLLEHLWHPEHFMKEARRILKLGGKCVSLVPDWQANYKTYFDDYTHRTPFTKISLTDLYRICDFTQVEVSKFRQLPIVWKYPALNILCASIAPFVPVRTKKKFLRWSKELMLIGSGVKENGTDV